MTDTKEFAGIEELREAVEVFNNCDEGFNYRFTLDELIAIWRAYQASEWKLMPNGWAPRQIREAICGITPRWVEDETCEPIYDGPEKVRAGLRVRLNRGFSSLRDPRNPDLVHLVEGDFAMVTEKEKEPSAGLWRLRWLSPYGGAIDFSAQESDFEIVD